MNTNIFLKNSLGSLSGVRRIVAGLLTLSFLITPLTSYAGDKGDGGGGGGGGNCVFVGGISSDWAVAGNWSCAYVPTSVTPVVIPSAKSVESSAIGAISGPLEIQGGGSLTISGGTFEIDGSFNNVGAFTLTGGAAMNVFGPFTNAGSVALNGGTVTLLGYNPISNSGTISGSGTGTILEAYGISNSMTGTINHTGGWQIRVRESGFMNMGTYNSTADASIFRFTGSGSVIPTAVIYPNLEFGGSISPPDYSHFVAYGDITLLSGLELSGNSSSFALSGNWTTEAATVISNNHTTVEFIGSATSTLTADPGGAAFYDIKVNKAAVDKGVMLLSDAMATHALVMTKGIFDYNGYTLFLPGSCTFVGGATPSWGMPANWSCAGAARLPNVIDTVTIPNGKSPVLSSLVTRVGPLAIESGATLEVQAGGSLSVYGTSTNTGTITINSVGGSTAGIIALEGGGPSTSTNNGIILALNGGKLAANVPLQNLGIIDMSSSGTLQLGQNMPTVGSLDVSGLGELILTGPGNTAFPPNRFIPAVPSIGTLTIAIDAYQSISLMAYATTTHALNLNNGYLDLNGNTLSLDGAASLMVGASGGFYGGGTLEFTGSGDQTIGAPIYTTISSMRIRKTSGQVSQGTSVISVAGAFDVVSGTYLIDGGVFMTNGSFTIYAAGTVSSTVSSNLNSLAGLTNAGTVYIDGNNYTAGGIINNGTIYLGSALSMTVDTLTNNNTISSDAASGMLTLTTAFTKGEGSTFSAPLYVLFQGPAAMPAYSYNQVTIYDDVTLSAGADTTLSFGAVTLSPGVSGPIWTILNAGSTQSDVGITIDSLNIQSGTSVVLSGTSVGPTVTTTHELTNNGSLTVNEALLSLGGIPMGIGGTPTLIGSGDYTFTNSDLRFFGDVPETIPAATYHDLSLLGSGTYTLSASTTVMATTTIASSATLDLSTYRLSAIGDIANTGLITSSTGAVLHHPVDYVRFSDSSGTLVSSLTDGDSLYVTLKDQSRNLNGSALETMVITATSTAPAGSDSESLTLTETSASSGIFRNVSAIPVDGVTIATTENGTFELIGDGIGNTTYSDAFDVSDSSSTSVTLAYTQPVSEPESTPVPTVNRGGGALSSGGGGGSIVLFWNNSPAQLIPTPTPPLATQPSIEPSIPTTPPNTLEVFLRSGTTPSTKILGSGERLALLKDARETMGRTDIPVEDLERMAEGKIPKTRNLIIERTLAPRALATFKALYNHAPNFNIPSENLAWNTLMYRIRFPRDLKQESQGIQKFKQTFKKTPSDPFQWAVVRVLGYVNR
ncbi:hypothetical protein KBA73_02405 [Patescibacteria group bacterium]|nr:hypothetical protein [Patescibacteria group bacterium]